MDFKFTADPLGDGISDVTFEDKLGTDLTVVNVARVSLAKRSDWEYDHRQHVGYEMIEFGGSKMRVEDILTNPHLKEEDVRLIAYLSRNNHWTPFGHPQIQFHLKMPIFVAREWFRHTAGLIRGPEEWESVEIINEMASEATGDPVFNEVSRRYVDTPPEFFVTSDYRLRDKSIKQGSKAEIIEHPDRLSAWHKEYYHRARLEYTRQLDMGIAPEVARNTLPVSTYTEFFETASLFAYARICGLRVNPRALKECRVYAEAISEALGHLFPVSWKALREVHFGN